MTIVFLYTDGGYFILLKCSLLFTFNPGIINTWLLFTSIAQQIEIHDSQIYIIRIFTFVFYSSNNAHTKGRKKDFVAFFNRLDLSQLMMLFAAPDEGQLVLS